MRWGDGADRHSGGSKGKGQLISFIGVGGDVVQRERGGGE